MSGYSGTPLAKKLGIKDNFRIYLKNPPGNYLSLVNPLPDNVCILRRLSKDLDLVHFFSHSKRELTVEIPRQLDKIQPNGMIWVSWPEEIRQSANRYNRRCDPRNRSAFRTCGCQSVCSGRYLVWSEMRD